MENNLILRGVKLKIILCEPIRSLKLLTECEEKFNNKLRYERKQTNDYNSLLFLKRKRNKISYKISFKDNSISISVENVNKLKMREILLEMKKCIDLFKQILYSYMGKNVKVKTVFFLKGYEIIHTDIIEYLKSIETPFTDEKVRSRY